MLRPIPMQILKTAATLKVPIDTDRWGEPVYQTYELKRTHLQPSNSVKKTRDNADVVLRSLLFYDCRNSLPRGLDFNALKTAADDVGGVIALDINGLEYHLETVEAIPDDRGAVHHYELGLV